MLLFLEQCLNGLQFGLLLFLLAAGLTLVFGIMDLVNLAHGSLYMVGAYFAATFVAWTGSFVAGAILVGASAWWALSGPPGYVAPIGLRVTFLDVGQGDAELLEVPQGAMLIDTGPPEARVDGQLRALGVRSLSAVVLTHPHPDHALGLFAVLEELPVGAFWRSRGEDESGFFRDLEAVAARRAVPVRPLSAGETLRCKKSAVEDRRKCFCIHVTQRSQVV